MVYQTCKFCSKWRVVENGRYSEWNDPRGAAEQQLGNAEKVVCEACDRQRLRMMARRAALAAINH